MALDEEELGCRERETVSAAGEGRRQVGGGVEALRWKK